MEEAGYDYGEKNLFAHAMAVIFLILVIQVSFIYTILMEYMSTPKVITDDPELIALRVTAFLSMGILLWTILSNGKKIFLAAYYHEYLFKSKQRNTMCLVAGFLPSLLQDITLLQQMK